MPSRRHFLQTGSIKRPIALVVASGCGGSDAALLGGAAAVVRQRGDVLDHLDGQSGGLQGGDGRLAAAARPLDPDLDLLDAELGGLLGALLGGALGGERRALAAALEADGAGRGVAERVAVGVGDGADGVVERRLDVGHAPADVPPRLALRFLGHGLPHLLDALLAGDGLARPLAGAGVGLGPLAAHRQPLAVAGAAVAVDVAQARDVLLHLPAQRALDGVLAVEDAHQPADLVVGQFLGLALRVEPRLVAQLPRRRRADPVEVAQRNVRRLVARDIDALDTGHLLRLLALPLLVPRVFANHVHPAAPLDELALLANALDARTNFHLRLRGEHAPWESRKSSVYTGRASRQEFCGHDTGAAAATGGAAAGAEGGSSSAVSTSTPPLVIASVCSTWALGWPSRVTTVQWSRRVSVSARPRFTIGSTASTSPSSNLKLCLRTSLLTKLGTCGGSCITRPMPWPTYWWTML